MIVQSGKRPAQTLAWCFIGVALFGAFLRLHNLDYMAFHHDESIHSYYAYQIYTGNLQAYKYDPTYHGPFLYHYGALFFSLFGDTDFTARLPFVSFGLLLLFFIWRLRPWIGTYGSLFTMTLAALSPTLVYFSRFARNDIYIAATGMGVLVFGLEYLRDRKSSQLAWMTFFLALMYCVKENSIMSGFFMGSYIVFFGVYYVFSAHRSQRGAALADVFVHRAPFVKIATLYALFTAFAFSLVWYVTRHFGTLAKNDMPALRGAWEGYIADHGWVYPFWLILFAALTAGLFLLFWWVRQQVETPAENEPFFRRLARSNAAVMASVLIALVVYSLLFTTLGTNPGGMKAGVIDYLLYWMGQQDAPRIPGPATYYIPRLLLYELAPVFFALAAYFVYSWYAFGAMFNRAFQTIVFLAVQAVMAIAMYFFWSVAMASNPNVAMTLLKMAIALLLVGLIAVGVVLMNLFGVGVKEDDDAARDDADEGVTPDGLRVFFIYWSIWSILIYALLQEKVPWLMVHQALPLILLAGTFMGDVFERLQPGFWRKAAIALIAVFFAYEARTSILLNFYNPDNPRELMVYTQTTHTAKSILKEIRETAALLGKDYCGPNPTKVIAALGGTPGMQYSTWPYAWYLRNYLTETLYGNMPTKNVPFALVDLDYENRMKIWADGNYQMIRVQHRAWWPYGVDELPFSYYRRHNGTFADAIGAIGRYVMWRKLWNENDPTLQPGASDILFYRRFPLVDPVEKIQAPKGYDQAPRPLKVLAQRAERGAGDGQFNAPCGVALSPDETRLYVVDSLNGRVQVLNAENLEYITQFGSPGTGPGQFAIPGVVQWGDGPNGGIAVGQDGTVYVTDTWGGGQGRINRYTADGQPLPALVPQNDSFYFPRGLALSPDGTLYVTDTGNHRVVRFDSNGTWLGTFISQVIHEPVGITVAKDGLIYVCDVEGKRVAAFNNQGQFVQQWTVYGWNSSDQMVLSSIEPYVTLDPVRNVYITDSSINAVHAFKRGTDEVVLAGGSGNNPGNLSRPKGIVIDSKYNMFIADSANHRVLKAMLQ
ncbi:MAG: TIGR03663 family protein [bacterium]|nr:TIGR03663 family protein [bacterium]